MNTTAPILQGRILSVTTITQGGIATGTAPAGVLVSNAADFSRDGGWLTTEADPVVVWAYTGVLDGPTEADPDTVLVEPAVRDAIGTAITGAGGDLRISVYPATPETVAMVQLMDGTSDAVPAVVPHALRPLLADGVREDLAQEWTVLVHRAGTWYVDDIIGRPAQIQSADALAEPVWEVIAANGGNLNTYRDREPTVADGAGRAVGDSWSVYDPARAAAIVSRWRWDGAAWQPMVLTSDTIDNLDAGKIQGGILAGVRIVSPYPGAVPRLEIANSTLTVTRGDPSEPGMTWTSMSLGGATADKMLLFDPTTGEQLAGFAENGDGMAQNMTVNSLAVGGEPLDSVLYRLPRGLVAAHSIKGTTTSVSNVEAGVAELAITAEYQRTYEVRFEGFVNAPANVRFQLHIKGRTGGNGLPANAPTPTAATSFASGIWQSTTSGLQYVVLVARFRSNYTLPSEFRFLLTLRNLTDSQSINVQGAGTGSSTDASVSWLTITDVGGAYDSDFRDGVETTGSSTTAPVRKQYVETLEATWLKSWRSGAIVTDGVLHQGYYGGDQRYTMGGWGSLASRLSGATLTKAELYLESRSFYYGAGGKARIGRHNNTSTDPGTFTNTGGSAAAFDSPLWAAGTGKWITLPSSWYADMVSGTWRGFTLGEGVGQDMNYYGKFTRLARLRLTYTK